MLYPHSLLILSAFQVAQWLRIHLQCRRHEFNSRVRKIPWRRKWQHTPVFLPEKSHGEEPGGLQSMGRKRVRDNLASKQQYSLDPSMLSQMARFRFLNVWVIFHCVCTHIIWTYIYIYASIYVYICMSCPDVSVVKNLSTVRELQGTRIRSLGQEDPLEEAQQPTPIFLPGESHEQRSLAGTVHGASKS